jgi:hypothetical protein
MSIIKTKILNLKVAFNIHYMTLAMQTTKDSNATYYWRNIIPSNTLDYFTIYASSHKTTDMLRETFTLKLTLKFRFVQTANSWFLRSVSQSVFQLSVGSYYV